MGLSLSLLTGIEGSEETRACCIIGRDAAPAAPTAEKKPPTTQAYPNSAYHPSRGHYGSGYNNQSYGGPSPYGGYGGQSAYGGYGGYGGQQQSYGGYGG